MFVSTTNKIAQVREQTGGQAVGHENELPEISKENSHSSDQQIASKQELNGRDGKGKHQGGLVQATTEVFSGVVASIPLGSQFSTMLGATTRAAHWLANVNWTEAMKDSFGLDNIDVSGFEKETKFLLKQVKDLQENNPLLRKATEEIVSLKSEIESTSDPETLNELNKTLHGKLSNLVEHISESANSIHSVRDSHASLLSQMRDNYESQGLSITEINKKIKPLLDAREGLDKTYEEMNEAAIDAISKFKSVTETWISKQETCCGDLVEKAVNVSQSCSVNCSSHIKELQDDIKKQSLIVKTFSSRLDSLKNSLEAGTADAEQLHDLYKECRENVEKNTNHMEHVVHKQAEHLLEHGADAGKVATFEKESADLISQIRENNKMLFESFSTYENSYSQYQAQEQSFYKTHDTFLRMQSVANHGGAGHNVMSLGLFDSPYAMTALSFIEEHIKELKKAKALFNDFYEEKESKNIYFTSSNSKELDEKKEFEKLTGQVLVGPISAAQRLSSMTAKILQTDKMTFQQPVANKSFSEKDILA